RTSNLGNPALAGSSAPAGLTKQSVDNGTESALSQLVGPTAGTGLLDSSKSWEAYVEPTFTTASFYGNAGFNPDSAVSPSTVLYEDLWETSDAGDPRGSSGQPYDYIGYFTLDLTGSSPSLTFTPQAVPEPTVLGLLGGAGLLLLSFRRRFNLKNS
ncbi:MAG TPA: PEP-CTERM sorting domain-containing protein, partial [Candidatus Sulfopaludibacter sp.]|nr:PEP-CTERM sorting domain-containing protein [Candidatus Sulfopaludibacter sp.]